MRWLLIGGLVVTLSIAPADDDGCAGSSAWGGNCSVENTGTSVEIGATQPGDSDTENSESDTPRSSTDDGTDGTDSTDGADESDAADTAEEECGLCRGSYSVMVIRPTLEDVASFAPAPVALVDEPDGVGVVGMPVNFVVAPAVHEQAGELFDLDVSVRFTPASVVFVHGDGTTRESTSFGSTWGALGLPQFSATATSHAYGARGTYSANAIVRYTAEFNLGRGWSSIDGVLEIPTSATDIQILEVRTALVDLTCTENPSGPGC
ncbi:MAG: hypothetical protein QM677_11400 [Microbacterium sp.]